MHEVYQARDPVEAHFVRAVLKEAGVEAVVQGENLGIAAGEIPFFLAYPTVHVRDEDAAAAREVIDRLRTPREAVEGEPWRCPECGEMVEPQFTECWHCAPGSREAFVEANADAAGPSCRRCGHDLRGSPPLGHCPECGEPYARG